MDKYYVYRHLDAKGNIFYIGMGSGTRSNKRNGRSKIWKNIVKNNNNDFEVQILSSNLSRETAMELETILIEYHKGKYDSIINIGSGGEGIGLTDRTEYKPNQTSFKKGSVPWNKGVTGYKVRINQTSNRKKQIAWNKGLTGVIAGEDIGTSKLTEKEVLEIRNKFIPRIYTRQMLGDEYGVSPATIKDIILRKSWKHI